VAEVLKVLPYVPLQVDVPIPEVVAASCAARWVKAQGGYWLHSWALVGAQFASRAAQAFE
jgi:hypothetical protein